MLFRSLSLIIVLILPILYNYVSGSTIQSSSTFAATTTTTSSSTTCCNENEWMIHPILCGIILHQQQITSFTNHSLQQQQQQPIQITSSDLYHFSKAMGWIVDLRNNHDDDDAYSNYSNNDSSIVKETSVITTVERNRRTSSSNKGDDDVENIPVVLVHGMGDSCYNDGMIHITQYVSQLLNNTYTICIPIGTSQSEDTNNGYFLNMNDSIDYFAQQVQLNSHLMSMKTFHAVGLSQGNNIIRGYIAKYNTEIIPIHTFISINGVNAGVGAVPHCIPDEIVTLSSSASLSGSVLQYDVAMSLCDLLMEQASAAAYTNFAQQHSFQANYWRDPRPSEYNTYCSYSQLARYNNEVIDDTMFNETYRTNWGETTKFVWIMANDDKTVYPPQGEQWGAPDPNDPYRHVLPMNETEWYIHDYFGLQTAQKLGKNYFESFPGDHLQFTKDDFKRWILTYLS